MLLKIESFNFMAAWITPWSGGNVLRVCERVSDRANGSEMSHWMTEVCMKEAWRVARKVEAFVEHAPDRDTNIRCLAPC